MPPRRVSRAYLCELRAGKMFSFFFKFNFFFLFLIFFLVAFPLAHEHTERPRVVHSTARSASVCTSGIIPGRAYARTRPPARRQTRAMYVYAASVGVPQVAVKRPDLESSALSRLTATTANPLGVLARNLCLASRFRANSSRYCDRYRYPS